MSSSRFFHGGSSTLVSNLRSPVKSTLSCRTGPFPPVQAAQMEHQLRCNNQQGGFCRVLLTDEAVVTNCSHVICVPCARKTGFVEAPLHQRTCPVCRTALPNSDDAVCTRLNPSDDYKTSVLSGLDPATIMECASRALAFWSYQTQQELFYQDHLQKTMKDKYTQLGTAMDRIVNEANAEIDGLQKKLTACSADHKSLQQKYDDLAHVYREKSKKCTQAQQLYDALKKKVLMKQVATAATNDVDQTLESINQSRPATYQDLPQGAPTNGTHRHFDHPRASDGLSRHSIADLLATTNSPVVNEPGARRVATDMPPPQRSAVTAANIHADPSATPFHRSALPVLNRATANRSHIPLSTSKEDYRPQPRRQNFAPASTIRQHLTADGVANRSGGGTPRGQGILRGMKVGRAGTSGLGEPRSTQREAVHGSHQNQLYERPFDSTGQYGPFFSDRRETL